jgi:hypothetical protein
MPLLSSSALLLLAMQLLATADPRQRRRRGAPPLRAASARAYRMAATTLALGAYLPAAAALQPSYAALFWPCALGLAGLAVALLQGLRVARRPRG